MRLKFWMGILISVVFLYFFSREINWIEVWRNIKSIHYAYLPLVVFLHMAVYVLRAQRWRYLLEHLKKISLFRMFSATMIGFMANNILPFRLGEIAKAYVVGQREGISKSASLATVVVERLFDALVILMFLIGIMLFFPFPRGFEQNKIINPYSLKLAATLSTGLCVGIILFLVIARLYFQKMRNVLGKILLPRFPHFHEKLIAAIGSFVSGLDSLSRGGHMVSVIIYSVLIWLMISLTFYGLYPAFNIQLPYSSAILMAVVVAVGVAVPSSPGFVGTFHLACASCLILLDIEPNKAKSFALILHGVIFVPVTVMGLLFVYFDKIDLKQIKSLENAK
ncbi:MAG: flippase-like domain-containing protein [Candidatus Schekmanbacteria bacterium]|nr:flippase-like domain-containing protein [Candidatus Schekmanbacteria bacterium]